MAIRERKDTAMTDQNHRRHLFGQALGAARRARRLSQAELGQKLPEGVVQATISSWESGATEPTAQQVFDLEDVLETGDNLLSQHLGYSRYLSSGRDRSRCAADYLADDPNLDPWAQRALLDAYMALAEPTLTPSGAMARAVLVAAKTEFQGSVADGEVTQDQADLMVKKVEAVLQAALGRGNSGDGSSPNGSSGR